jgi:hypothetical protein
MSFEGFGMRRIKLPFAGGLEVEFADRDKAIKQVEDFAERGTRYPVVVFGPEGCGKSAWFKQAIEVLRGYGYDAIYIDPLHKGFIACTDVKDVVRRLSEVASEVIGIAEIRLATLAIDVVKELLSRWRRGKVAILVDEVFQAIGLDKAGIYVKSLLNLIEYPPRSYEGVVAMVATSEGVSRREVGRHRWATLKPMWNMSKRGFEELYEKIPRPKPAFEDLWMKTGGNPDALAKLYQAQWDADTVIKEIIVSKNLDSFTSTLSVDEKTWIIEAIEDPDTLLAKERMLILEKLIHLNLAINGIAYRDQLLWIDEPPPERDIELGIGRHIAWQTPLHREAVKKVITQQ